MDSPETLTLVRRAQGGDSNAFGQLYDMYASRIYRFIKLKIPAREQAEDMLQDTFLKAWQALPRLRLDNLYFGAWLYKVARNLVNDHYRKAYRTPMLEDIDDHHDIAAATDTAEAAMRSIDIDRVRALLPQLKAEYRQVLELRFVQEFSVAETAKVMGKSQVAVRLVQYRALKKLNAALVTKPHHEPAGV